MIRTLVLAAACVVVVACKDKQDATPPAETPPVIAPSRTDTPAVSTTPTREVPATGADGGSSSATAMEPPSSAGEGRMAKPGWCNEDKDCKRGEVCEKCGDHAQCSPGCHRDDQCNEGEKCGEVQCVRCPCPGQCEALNETPE